MIIQHSLPKIKDFRFLNSIETPIVIESVITNYDTLESAAKVIIKMLAVGIPTYSMDLLALEEEKKQLIAFLNEWYIENIVEKENFK